MQLSATRPGWEMADGHDDERRGMRDNGLNGALRQGMYVTLNKAFCIHGSGSCVVIAK
jgi:hypothetical protein